MPFLIKALIVKHLLWKHQEDCYVKKYMHMYIKLFVAMAFVLCQLVTNNV